MAIPPGGMLFAPEDASCTLYPLIILRLAPISISPTSSPTIKAVVVSPTTTGLSSGTQVIEHVAELVILEQTIIQIL